MTLRFFIVERSGAVVWRGFSCCHQHAIKRAVLGGAPLHGWYACCELEPGHPRRREVAA